MYLFILEILLDNKRENCRKMVNFIDYIFNMRYESKIYEYLPFEMYFYQ